MNTFTQTLTHAERVERVVAMALRQSGWEVRCGKRGTICDISVTSPDCWLLEVKDEQKFSDSPNLCIETFQGNPRRASGIFASSSTHGIHIFGGDCCLIYFMKDMRNWIISNVASHILKPRLFSKSDNYNGGILIQKSQFCRGEFFGWTDKVSLSGIASSKIFLSSIIGSPGRMLSHA